MRKMAMFACACAGRLNVRRLDDLTIRGLALAERMADGAASLEEVRQFGSESLHTKSRSDFLHIAVWAVRVCEADVGWSSPLGSALSVAEWMAAAMKKDEPAIQCDLLREVLGNPYRPVSLDTAWRTSNVIALAQAIYDEKAFDRLPILADALEDAGCDNADILNHCREPGEHVRGCWAVDLVLGKE